MTTKKSLRLTISQYLNPQKPQQKPQNHLHLSETLLEICIATKVIQTDTSFRKLKNDPSSNPLLYFVVKDVAHDRLISCYN